MLLLPKPMHSTVCKVCVVLAGRQAWWSTLQAWRCSQLGTSGLS